MLSIHNTLSGQKETFKPKQAGKIGIYVCGVTVYDYCHIGHGRTFAAFDLITRYLRFRGYDVHFVRNITDVDDKIIKRANETGQTCAQVTETFIAEMDKDFAALGILKPDEEPRATQSMHEIIHLIADLVENGSAYVSHNGDVYYRVSQFDEYGKLSKQDLSQLQSGDRVYDAELKQSELDFALWKSAKPDEPSWESPWGLGRPGWHIECSAMSKKCLGASFDIHGGGSDLIFPHHENEIAQSEAANQCGYANYWLHTGMVKIDNEKMSKSLNNFFTIRDVLNSYPAEVVRYFLVTNHYRSHVNYSQENLDAAKASLSRLYTALRDVDLGTELAIAEDDPYYSRFCAAMDDDFNAPEAVAVLFELTRELNKAKEQQDSVAQQQLGAMLKQLAAVFGLLQQSPDAFLQGGAAPQGASAAHIDDLIAQRNQARLDKNWARADEIRDELNALNVVLEDKGGVTTWRSK